MFHDEKGPVPETFRRLRDDLDRENIPYVVIGAIALSAHHFRRATEDIDICMRREDLTRFRHTLVGNEFQSVEGRTRRFYDPRTQVTFDVLIAGELAGRTARNDVIRFPDPSVAQEINGIRTVSLPSLIELKLVTWRLKDWADVVALIRANKLDESFAREINPLVRMAYLECYDNMVEEDRYDREG